MIDLKLSRRWLTDRGTVGEMTASRGGGEPFFSCYTLEDRYRPPPEPKVPGETCIPTGRYPVVVDRSERFGADMPHVLNVPGFAGIRIHAGNTVADTQGCILVGLERDDESPEPRILKSRLAYEGLFRVLQMGRERGEPVFITIDVQPEGATP